MKTQHRSVFSLQSLAFALVAAVAMFIVALPAPAQTGWGNALSFDGVDDYVQSQQPVDLANRSFSIEAWAQRRSSDTMDLAVGQGYGAPNQCIIFGFHYYAGNQFLFDFYGNGIGSGTADTDTAWHHWAGTYDATSKRHCLYRDGVLLACHTNSVEHYQGSGLLWIGVGYFGEAPNEFDGQIDEVRIWGVARSQAEIQENMLRPLSGSEANLLAYWNFNEGTGTSASDSSTNGLNATLINGPTWTASTLPQAPVGWGNALSFDGVNDHVTFSRPVSNDFTLECWFRTIQSFGSGSGHWWDGAGLVDGEVNGGMRDFGVSLGAGRVLFGTGGSVDVTLRSPNSMADGQWHHVAATRQKSNGAMQLFVDGSLVASGANASGVSLDLPTQLRLGSLASGANFFNGQIDDVRIWNQVRSVDQIREGLCHPLTGYESGLVAYFRLDEETGTIAFDATANHCDGTLVSGPVQQPSTIPPFVNINAALPASWQSAVAWVDCDNDGLLDILVRAIEPPSDYWFFHVWQNRGNGNFLTNQAGLPQAYLGSFDSGDYDNDGRLDILISTITTNYTPLTQVWRNTDSGFTNVPISGLPQLMASPVAWGDYDNDGRRDFVLSGQMGGGLITQVWRNTGSGFTNINAGLPGVTGGAVAWGDYDNDGRLDLLLTGYTNQQFVGAPVAQVWRNNGDNTFSNISAGLPGVWLGSVAWADYDNDGRLDILLTGDTLLSTITSSPIVQVWRNTGSGFTNINAGLPGLSATSVGWGDYDNDGRLDLLLVGMADRHYYTGKVAQIWRNTSSGFTNVTATIAPGLPQFESGSVAWGDYDNDGRLDLLLTGTTNFGPGAFAQLWRNIGPGTNTRPSAPTDLAADVTGRQAWLSWTAASDAQTPAAGLSYSLRVGTTPGAWDVVSPPAAVSSGLRRLPARGRLQPGVAATLRDLPLGVYYWSVQAVDTAFAGSPFSGEGRFVVALPEVETLTATNVTSTGTTLQGRVNPMQQAALAWFEYGLSTKYGSVTPPVNVGQGPDPVAISIPITGLLPWMTYHYRAVGSNSVGRRYGTDQTIQLPGPSSTTPALSELADVTLPQGSSRSVGFTASPAGVNVQVRGNNPVLLPSAGLTLAGSGPDYTLGLWPDPKHSGSAQVTVTAGDGTHAVTRTFTLTVTPLDADPSQLLYLTGAQAVSAEAWQFRIQDFGTASTNYTVEYRSDLSPTNIWVPATNVADLTGGLYRVDTGPPPRGTGWYRVRGLRWLSAGFDSAAATMDEGAVSGPVIVFNGLYTGSVSYSWSGTEGTNTGTVQVNGSTAVIPLPMTDNTELDELRYLTLRLEGGPGVALGGTTASTITVEENDAEWQGVLQNGQASLGFILKIQQSGGNFQGEIKSRGFGFFPTNALAQLTFSMDRFCAVATNVPLPALAGSPVFNLPHHVDLRLDAANGPTGQTVSETLIEGVATLVSVVPGRPELDTVVTNTFRLAKHPTAASTYEAPLHPVAP